MHTGPQRGPATLHLSRLQACLPSLQILREARHLCLNHLYLSMVSKQSHYSHPKQNPPGPVVSLHPFLRLAMGLQSSSSEGRGLSRQQRRPRRPPSRKKESPTRAPKAGQH